MAPPGAEDFLDGGRAAKWPVNVPKSRPQRADNSRYPDSRISAIPRRAMFSNAGKLYDDEKKGQEDESLEHALFASANTE